MMSTLGEIIEREKLEPITSWGDPWRQYYRHDLGAECQPIKQASGYTLYDFGSGYLWAGPHDALLSSRIVLDWADLSSEEGRDETFND